MIPARDKKPLVAWKHYQERRQTWDELVIDFDRSWSQAALLTGELSGVVVLDFDVKDGGQGTFDRLGLPQHVRTGSGGAHVYVRHPGFPVKKVARPLPHYPGMDVQGEKGIAFFFGPGKGGMYRVGETWPPEPLDPAAYPEVLAILRSVERIPRSGELTEFGTWEGEGLGDDEALRVLGFEAGRVAHAGEGERNGVINRAVYAVAGLVAAGALDVEHAQEQLRLAAEQCGYAYEPEFEGVFQQSWDAGYLAPWTPEPDPGALSQKDIEALLSQLPDAPTPRARLKRLSTVTREEVTWLWAGRIPLGKLVILGGDPGGGKTFLALKLCAAVTRGEAFPGDPRPGAPGTAVYITLEDGVGDTLRPRAEQMGADLERLFVIGLEDAPKAASIRELEPELAALEDLRLIVIDPLDSYVGAGPSTGRANEIRDALRPTVELAERLGCAVVIITHTNKDSRATTAMQRIGGSLGGIGGYARSTLFVGQHQGGRAVAVAKCNLAPLAPAVPFSIADDGVTWGEELAGVTADGLITRGARSDAAASSPKLETAKRWLAAALAGGPRPQRELQEEADQEGITARTLKDAKAALKVVSSRPGGKGGWVWELLGGVAWEEVPRRR